jgi:glucosamine--fructose-6-phosphate aminotransferase (isomerizing)
MCGIVGYIGARQAPPRRGYDFAGIAIQSDSGIALLRIEGKVVRLERSLCARPVMM